MLFLEALSHLEQVLFLTISSVIELFRINVLLCPRSSVSHCRLFVCLFFPGTGDLSPITASKFPTIAAINDLTEMLLHRMGFSGRKVKVRSEQSGAHRTTSIMRMEIEIVIVALRQ